MERFTLTPKENLQWVVTDHETGITVEFMEGLFNETQKVNHSFDVNAETATKAATAMREIGEYMKLNHREVAMCYPPSRRYVLCLLANEKYWLAMADALNSTIIDWSDEEAAEFLFSEMDDYITMNNSVGLTEQEASLLRGSLSFLDDIEAMEVVDMVFTFWKYKSDGSITEWARDLLWWPALCPQSVLEEYGED